MKTSLRMIGAPLLRSMLRVGLAAATVGVVAGSAGNAGATASFDPATGKWYEAVLVPNPGITWGNAEAGAVALGGYLACPTGSAENTFVFNLIDTNPYWTALSVNRDFLGPWLGASASNDTNGTNATWTWLNGATFSYAPWGANQPDGYPGNLPAQAVCYYDFSSIGSTWGDAAQNGTPGFTLPQGYVVEFDQNPDAISTAVPEPSPWALLALGVLGCAAYLARRPGRMPARLTAGA